jgi:hypothetical protein
MNEMDGPQNLDRLTTGGTSAAVAIKIQMTPLRKENISVSRKVKGQRERLCHLSPEESTQTKRASVTAYTKQAKEHD